MVRSKFSSRKSNNLIIKVHEEQTKRNDFKTLLENNKELKISQISLQASLIEAYIIVNDYVPTLMESLFVFRESTYNAHEKFK